SPTSADLAQAGTASVQVVNGGGASNIVLFTIAAPKSPVITSLEPPSAIVGSTLSQVIINGTDLINSNGTTQVLWNGQNRTVNTGQSTATRLIFIPQTYDLSQAGIATVRVLHRTVTPNGEVLTYSNVANFTINQVQGPTITSLNPASTTVPITTNNSILDQTIGVVGTNFAGNAVVRVNGKSVATSFSSSARLNATIPGALIASQTGLNFSVLNPTTNLTSNVAAFPINQTAPDTVGSILAYPLFYSICSAGTTVPICTANTTISLTNSNAQAAARIRLFFVEGLTGIAVSTIRTINPNQTLTMLASDIAPSKTGYVLAVAINNSNCPTVFNFLRGAETVTG
ncbi:MAG: hypothetical protein ACRD82_09885, partial [Blastocatellia bacterium]